MIRQLRDGDVEAFVELRREALLDSPLAFVASPSDDLFSSPGTVREQLWRAPEAVILGAFRPRLVGAVGLYRDRLLKSSHKAHLWGMYVTPNHRRQGVASELLDAVLRHAAALPGVSWVHLKVSAATPSAQRLYERAGFRVWGTEPAGARYDDQTVVDYHMALCLEPDAGSPVGLSGQLWSATEEPDGILLCISHHVLRFGVVQENDKPSSMGMQFSAAANQTRGVQAMEKRFSTCSRERKS